MSSIDIEGIDQTRLKLAFMKNPRVIAGSMKSAAIHVKGVAATYPAELSWSSYRRTNNLHNRWAVKLLPLGAMVSNNASYGPYVQDDYYQTIQHAMTGWKTTDEVSESESEAVVKIIMSAINRVINS